MVGVRVLLDHLPLVVSLLVIQVLLLPSQMQHLLAEHVPPCSCTHAHYLLEVGTGDVFS